MEKELGRNQEDDVGREQPNSPVKKRSKLSEVFKAHDLDHESTSEGPVSTPTDPSTSQPSISEASTSTSQDQVRSEPHVVPTSSTSTLNPPPTIGKGVGKKGASAFVKGSPTQQQIWITQERIESLESFLNNNMVI